VATSDGRESSIRAPTTRGSGLATEGRPVHRSKAPRVQCSPDLFAVVRRTRPSASPLRRSESQAQAGGREPRPFTGPGARGETATPRLPPPGRPGDVDIRTGRATPDAEPPSTTRWSHDRRCPSGSGRGRAVESSREGDRSSAGRRKTSCPWPVRPRLANRRHDASSFGSTRRAHGVTRTSRCRHDRRARKRSKGVSAPRRRESDGPRGCARGLCWLQKSTSGARSRSKDRGSSWVARMPRGVCAHRANRRRKPDRGGESHHAREQRDRWRAPRDPTRRRESDQRDRGREHSYDGRRLGPGRASSLTRRRRTGTSVAPSEGSGQRCSLRGGPRQKTSETISRARLGAKSTHAGRRSAEGSTIVTPPGPCLVVTVKPPAKAVGVTLSQRRSSKLEVRRQAKLHRVARPQARRRSPTCCREVAFTGGPG